MVMGEGKNPKIAQLISLGNEAKISKTRIAEIIDQTQTALASFEDLAKEYGVSASNIGSIGKHIKRK
jgi:serine/threonine-protein kinase HipA